MSDKGLNFVGQIFDRDGKLKTCKCLKDEFPKTKKLKLFQIIDALSKQWREIEATHDDNLSNVYFC